MNGPGNVNGSSAQVPALTPLGVRDGNSASATPEQAVREFAEHLRRGGKIESSTARAYYAAFGNDIAAGNKAILSAPGMFGANKTAGQLVALVRDLQAAWTRAAAGHAGSAKLGSDVVTREAPHNKAPDSTAAVGPPHVLRPPREISIAELMRRQSGKP